MDKVKLPKKVAEALEYSKGLGFKNFEIIRWVLLSTDNKGYVNTITSYAKDNFDLFLQALVNDYEIDLTPEEKVKKCFDYYDDSFRDSQERAHALGVRQGIKNALDHLEIKIEGINS